MSNQSFKNAKDEKYDEYYTQYYDIEREIEAYLDYNPNIFRGKTVLLPCDDPEWSNFTRYFAQNFELLGLKKLISTSYAPESKKYKGVFQQSLFETESPRFDPDKSNTHGKIFVLTNDITNDGRVDLDDLQWDYLEGDGDFRSKEVTRLRDEADIIVTNPPFSLYRAFFSWIMEAGKQFILVANKNCATYKEIFPLIKDNKIWIGVQKMGVDMLFDVTKERADYLLKNEREGSKYRIVNGEVKARSTSCWFTNIDHGQRHKHMQLMTMEDNIRFNKHKDWEKKRAYYMIDNYNALNVPYIDAIPSDYEGEMAVPISFLDKYCPEQFEIIGIGLELADMDIIRKKIGKLNGGPRFYVEDKGELIRLYERIIIRKKQ
ncbi:MAG: adenine-specific methyltransferase EcoRI family protein [Bacteroidales bacterium]|nr:adenine-specific methyltransferase EcoRI family protein [Bacteroidales bacterium]